MKKISVITVIICLAGTALGQFTDPFEVSADLAEDATGLVLSVSFSVPEDHYLYEEALSVKAPEGVELKPDNIPQAKKKKDPFSDKTVGMYNHDVVFRYRVSGNASLPLNITIGYQGCDATQCFFPQTKPLLLNKGKSAGNGKPTGCDSGWPAV